MYFLSFFFDFKIMTILRQRFFDSLKIHKIDECLGNFVKTFFVYFISPLQF